MKSCRLSFGEIVLISDSLAEIIVDEGIVMDEVKIDEYHDFLLTHLKPPFGLLVNKKYSYTYTFEAQKSIIGLKELIAIAVVAKTSGSVMSTETVININDNDNIDIEIFQDRENALVWLQKRIT
ncbi:hypothetical protein GCM10022291_21150 [Postechiella marina]|uniref:STAS/SEC14 domain-containing protein n=1 Tax=Postechiella marina TaxID=943941 RepID=A0ABP8CB54_9FLAO